MRENVDQILLQARRMSAAIKFGINQQNFSPSTRQRNRSTVNPSYLETKGRLIVGTYTSPNVTLSPGNSHNFPSKRGSAIKVDFNTP